MREDKFDMYVYGGKGNSRFVSWDKEVREKQGSLNKMEKELMRRLAEKPLYDYKSNNKDYPKEWDNIRWGSEQWKISKKEWIGIWSATISVIGVIGYMINLLF